MNETSKLQKALELGPDVLDYIVSLNPHDFVRLRNPLMRRLMPPRITLARIARMVSIPVRCLIEGVHSAAGISLDAQALQELDDIGSRNGALPANPVTRPRWVRSPDVVVDLLESDVRLDADPLPPIMLAIKAMKYGDVVLIKHKWKPAPLYDVWKHMSVKHFAEMVSPTEWHIYVKSERQ